MTMDKEIKESKLSSLQFLLMTEDPGKLEQYQQLGIDLLDRVKGYLEHEDIASCQNVLKNLVRYLYIFQGKVIYSQDPIKSTGSFVCSVGFYTDRCPYLSTFLIFVMKIVPICIN